MSTLFSPIRIGRLELSNRVVLSPMQQYHGTVQSYANDHHVNFYSSRARGGAGLVIVETAAVAENGRFYLNDIGIFSPFHVAPMKRIVDAVKAENVPVMLQIGHAGRKSMPGPGRQLVAPSAIAFDAAHGVPREMTLAEIKAAVNCFADAASRAIEAGFDGIEIHAAHGYLIHEFLSPLSNQRTDAYGGSTENRTRFLYEIFAAIRQVTGPEFPVFVRVSATDYAQGGLDCEMVIESLRLLLPLGVDAIDVSTGGLLPDKPPGIGRNYQVIHAAKIREQLGLPTIAVGLIRGGMASENILNRGEADLIAYGRPFIEDAAYGQTLQADLAEIPGTAT